jgi:hypothetical protein
MDFKETFLKLTEYTVPFGYESGLESLLPNGWKKDSIGNYYYEIGNSKTLFTSHLDTACKEREKINHVIDGNIIKTDGTTILGGDNKAGCVALFYLIENNIPGAYYFFLGEEMSVDEDYPHGSLLAIEEIPNYFKKFERVISFDRKEKDQFITRQLGKNCCSDEFASALINEFSKNGVNYKKDNTGYYTDSAFFADIVPEVVNLSIGVWNEHHKNEYVDISYVESVSKAAAKIDWESLPTKRQINKKYEIDSRKNVGEFETGDDQNLFKEIFTILDDMYFVCHEIRSYKNYLYHFKPGRKYHFTKWHEDEDLEISISNGIISCNGREYKNLDDFKSSLGIEKMDINKLSKLMIGEFNRLGGKMSDARFNFLLYQKGGDLDELKKGIRGLGYSLNSIGKGYEIIKESYIFKKYKMFLENRQSDEELLEYRMGLLQDLTNDMSDDGLDVKISTEDLRFQEEIKEMPYIYLFIEDKAYLFCVNPDSEEFEEDMLGEGYGWLNESNIIKDFIERLNKIGIIYDRDYEMFADHTSVTLRFPKSGQKSIKLD